MTSPQEFKYPAVKRSEIITPRQGITPLSIKFIKQKQLELKAKDIVDDYCTSQARYGSELKYNPELLNEIYGELSEWRSPSKNESCFNLAKNLDDFVNKLSWGSRANLVSLLQKLIYSNYDDQNSQAIKHIAIELDDDTPLNIMLEALGILKLPQGFIQELADIKQLPLAISNSIVALYPTRISTRGNDNNSNVKITASLNNLINSYKNNKSKQAKIIELANLILPKEYNSEDDNDNEEEDQEMDYEDAYDEYNDYNDYNANRY